MRALCFDAALIVIGAEGARSIGVVVRCMRATKDTGQLVKL